MRETAKDIMDHFISRAKNLQKFVVETDVPENFRLNGRVPFDIKINENIISADVYALTFEEACSILNDYLEGCK